MLENDIASLMSMISDEEMKAANANKNSSDSAVIRGGAFELIENDTPFNLGTYINKYKCIPYLIINYNLILNYIITYEYILYYILIA